MFGNACAYFRSGHCALGGEEPSELWVLEMSLREDVDVNASRVSNEAGLSPSKVLELPRRPGTPGAAVGVETLRSDEDAEKVFRLQVQLDLQRERELLYRVVLVVETIVALMLAREWVLWLFF
jgi:hypothetical protein